MNNRIEIQIASDLHLEYITDSDVFADLIIPTAPILILAGDIGYPECSIYKEFINYCSKAFESVILIAGNHEYYSKKSIPEINKLISEIISCYDNVNFLNNNYIIMDNCVILGTTLWSMISKKEMLSVITCLSDLKKIHSKCNKKLDINAYNKMHIKNYIWLKKTMDDFEGKKIIVVSHHLPSFELINNKYKNSKINSAFASKLDHLFANVSCWIFGHSHSSCETTKNGCYLISNPHGYSDEENKQYNPCLTLTI